ncbi:MAG: purine-binding chemotaxis protein CheW [Rhodocyclales bacterium]|nr:purine-binding chemotaxis protein CheW [Rhodocyclales bacterium]
MTANSTAVARSSHTAPIVHGAGSGHQYLAFTLNGEVFAIDILQIREIIEFGSLTEVPMMPPTVRGVINLRGAVVPVIDLSARFGRTCTEVGRRTCIVIVEIEHDDETQTLGVLVDGVNEVMEIPAAEIEPAPAFGARIRTDFIRGMGRVDGRFVIILDVGKVFSVGEIAEINALAEA